MSHLATANVGRQAVGDGSLQFPGETLLPRHETQVCRFSFKPKTPPTDQHSFK